MTKNQSSLHSKLDDVIDRLATLETPRSSDNETIPPPKDTNRHMKLEVPRFDGSDATAWIFKINQFFDYHGTPENERIQIAFFYMDGPALSWFQWMFNNSQISSWQSLIATLEMGFAPSYYDDPYGALFKLS